MLTLEMNGPYALTVTAIETAVNKISAGNYALGKSENSTFYVSYVGRSDDDLRGRLKMHVGKYNHFKFSYALSSKAAFEKECKNFHDFGGTDSLHNAIHPDKPSGTYWECPYCK